MVQGEPGGLWLVRAPDWWLARVTAAQVAALSGVVLDLEVTRTKLRTPEAASAARVARGLVGAWELMGLTTDHSRPVAGQMVVDMTAELRASPLLQARRVVEAQEASL